MVGHLEALSGRGVPAPLHLLRADGVMGGLWRKGMGDSLHERAQS